MLYRPFWVGLVLLGLVLSTGLFGLVPAEPVLAQERCFPEQSERDCLSEPFATYWQTNGGLPVFGYPLTPAREEVNAETGTVLLTQWTERNRLESHPNEAPPYNIQIGRIGAERLAQLGRDPQTEGREAGPLPGCLWFEATGHNVCNQAGGLGFRSFWESNGLLDPRLDSYGRSLALFGLPLTEARMERSPLDGELYLMQWFERARFEWHPDNPDAFKVQLGLLGQEALAFRNGNTLPARSGLSMFGGEIVEGQVAQSASLARAANVDWVRYSSRLWPQVEPNPGERNWAALTRFEQEVLTLVEQQITPVVVVRHSAPVWARIDPASACGPITPDAMDAFARFMGDLVARYSQPPYNVRYWEIGNEPDAPFATGETLYGCWGNPAAPDYGGQYYGEMLKRIYPAIKAADPTAQIILGGLLLDCDPANRQGTSDCASAAFLEGVLQSGAGDAFDILAYHAYAYWSPGAIDWDRNVAAWGHLGGAMVGKLSFLRAVMQRYGIDKPMIANESALLCFPGVPCSENGFRSAQANYLVRTYTRAWTNGLSGAAWYTINAPGWRDGNLISVTGETYPAYHAFKFLSGLLANARPVGVLVNDPNGLEGYAFEAGANRYEVYWNNNDGVIALPLPSGTRTIYSIVGQPSTPTGASLNVGFEPVILALGP